MQIGVRCAEIQLYCSRIDSWLEFRLILNVLENKFKNKTARNKLGDGECKFIGGGLKKNETLKVLDLSVNQIGPLGCIYLSNFLKKNTTLIELNLNGNLLKDEGITRLSEGLKHNSTLISLHIAMNEITDAGAIHVFETLVSNKKNHISQLDVSYNNLSVEICPRICKFLKQTKMENFQMEQNGLGVEGAILMAKCLDGDNNTLRVLNMKLNYARINTQQQEELVMEFLNSLKYNTILCKVKIDTPLTNVISKKTISQRLKRNSQFEDADEIRKKNLNVGHVFGKCFCDVEIRFLG